MKTLPKLLLLSCLAGPLVTPPLHAAEPAAEKPKSEDGGKKKKDGENTEESEAPPTPNGKEGEL